VLHAQACLGAVGCSRCCASEACSRVRWPCSRHRCCRQGADRRWQARRPGGGSCHRRPRPRTRWRASGRCWHCQREAGGPYMPSWTPGFTCRGRCLLCGRGRRCARRCAAGQPSRGQPAEGVVGCGSARPPGQRRGRARCQAARARRGGHDRPGGRRRDSGSARRQRRCVPGLARQRGEGRALALRRQTRAGAGAECALGAAGRACGRGGERGGQLPDWRHRWAASFGLLAQPRLLPGKWRQQ